MNRFKLLCDDVVKYCILGLLHGYELRKLLIVSKWFNNLLSTLSDWNKDNDTIYWTQNLIKYYGNYGIWRRGWIDLSKGIFEKLSINDINQLKYFILRCQNEGIPIDINSLYLYNYSAEPQQVDNKIIFISNIIQYDLCRKNFNCIREIYLMNSNLRDDHIKLIANALLSRINESKLEILTLHNNQYVTELFMPLLFKAIGQRSPYLRNLDISQTRCGDQVCHIIYDFFHKYKKTKLCHINIENALHIISENGMKQLEQIISDDLVPPLIKYDFIIRTKLKSITSY